MSLDTLALAVLLAGGLGTLILLRPFLGALRSQSWASTTGTIVAAHVDSQMHHGKEFFKPIVTYTFEVHGTGYVGERVYYGQFAHSEGPLPAQEVVGDYVPNMDVTVYYDPAKPSRALLRPGVHGRLRRWIIVSIVMLIVGLMMSIA